MTTITLFHIALFIGCNLAAFGTGYFVCKDNQRLKRERKNRNLGPVALRHLRERRYRSHDETASLI